MSWLFYQFNLNSKSGKWKGSEYLNLFPEMEFNITDLDQLDINAIKIKFPEKSSVRLEKWLLD